MIASRRLLFHQRPPMPLLPPPTSLLLFAASRAPFATSLRLCSHLPTAATSDRASLPKFHPIPSSVPLADTRAAALEGQHEKFDSVDETDDGEDEIEEEGEEEYGDNGESEAQSEVPARDGSARAEPLKVAAKPPVLTVKEKKELAAYAHGLGKKLKSQQVGKSGVTASVVSSFLETLEANELLKLKIHGSCPGELPDVVEELEEATGSVVVGQIGRTVILYRPSLMKLKAEEKKRQARRIFVRKESKATPLLLQKARVAKVTGRGRRGSSRF